MDGLRYLVVGVYLDDLTRFAEDYDTETPEQAAQLAEELHPGLTVAGVIDTTTGEVVA